MTATDVEQPRPRSPVPSTVGDEATAAPVAPPGPASRPALTIGEVAALGGVLLVASVGAVALALAQIGRHDGWLAALLGVVVAAALSVVALVVGGRVALRVDKVELGLLAATLVAAGVAFLPGFPYTYADKDPGVYVNHAFAIARDGDVTIPDEIQRQGLDESLGVRTSFPGVWPAYQDEDATTSQFYHYTSTLMATADDIGGTRALFNLAPILAMLSMVVLVVAARRAAGTAVAAIAAVLMVSSMIQVWQSKYPSTEIPAQLFLSGALLGGVLAVERKWAGGAFVAGLLLGVGFLTRPDGFLYIMLAVGVAAIVVALGRADRRLWALGLGLLISVPGAFWNAYELRNDYSVDNSVPGPAVLLPVAALTIAGGVVAGGIRRWRRLDVLALLDRWRRPVGLAATVAFGLGLLMFWNRSTIFGTSYVTSGFTGERERDLNEFNLRWLSLFVTLPGLVVMWLGVGVVALRRTKPSLYLLLLPGTLLLPLYLWNAHVSMRMMWWVRRFVPAVWPAMLLLIAVALGWALLHRNRALKVAAAGGIVALVVFFASQSGPLRDHREMAGSWDMAATVAAPAGDETGVFLFARPNPGNVIDPLRNVPVGVWWTFGHTAAWLPEDYDMDTIVELSDALADRPVFVVVHDTLPESLPDERFELAAVMENQMPVLEEWPWGQPAEGEDARRPDLEQRIPQRLVVWELVDQPPS